LTLAALLWRWKRVTSASVWGCEKYPELRGALPACEAGATDCRCREISEMAADKFICGLCGGLGWLPADGVERVFPETLTQTVRVPWFPEPPCVITVAEALVQVALHTQHHRGQCMTRLKDFGGEPKNVDWIIWLWKQKPQARWD
jgi:hypothetical protein